jgi:hypothetical protein
MLATKFGFDEASMLAGRLFGRILSRNADEGGYEYALDCLQTGRKTVQQLIVELMTSDEFIDRFVCVAGYESAVKHIHWTLMGQNLPDDAETADRVRRLARDGLRRYIDDIVGSAEYLRLTGPNRVPERN